MQLPTIDRIQSLRPVAAEAASLVTGRVVPVVPVNPPAQVLEPAPVSPSVINLINQADKANFGEGVYSSVSDPTRKGAEASTPSKDWTSHQPVAEKVPDPPPEPLYKILIDHIKSLWLASAGAIQVQQQVRDQLDLSQASNHGMPGTLSNEVFTYSPNKINKTEKTQT